MKIEPAKIAKTVIGKLVATNNVNKTPIVSTGHYYSGSTDVSYNSDDYTMPSYLLDMYKDVKVSYPSKNDQPFNPVESDLAEAGASTVSWMNPD